jgi:hypothetical protein
LQRSIRGRGVCCCHWKKGLTTGVSQAGRAIQARHFHFQQVKQAGILDLLFAGGSVLFRCFPVNAP